MASKKQFKNIHSDKDQFKQIEMATKNIFFSFMYLMLKDYEGSLYFSIAMVLVQYLQLHYYIFHSIMTSVWNAKSLTDAFNYFFGFFFITPYFKNSDFSAYTILFFLMFSLLIFLILLSIYIAFVFHKTNTALTLPISFMRIIIQLWMNVLYMPLLEFYSKSWECSSDGHHQIFKNTFCWSGIHIVVVVCAVLAIIIFVIFNGLCVMTFYECRTNSIDQTSRTNSRSNFLFLVYQTVLVLVFSLIGTSQFIYIQLFAMVGGSLLVFLSFTSTETYHHQGVQTFNQVLAAVNFWGTIMLSVAQLMEGQVFQGSVIAWVIGVPFIIFIVLTNRDRQIEALIINVNKFANGEELMGQIKYILKLLRLQATNRHFAILLDGYIEVHKQTCNKEDCPLKQKKQKNTRITRAIMSTNEEAINEKYALLFQLIYVLYLNGLKKFPHNNDLRLAFAFFLLDKMKYKQQALQEVNTAEQYRPSFDIQFIIFRYKRIIETEIQESRNEGFNSGIEIIPSSAAPPLISALAQEIEKSAIYHMEFWSQLGEDTPDLGKLEQLGARSLKSVDDVAEKWIKLQKVNPNHQKSTRLYGRYLIEILNDTEAGDELLTRMRDYHTGARGKDITWGEDDNHDDFSNEPSAIFMVSCDTEHFGQIMSVNQAGASLFLYNKNELINQKIQTIMPRIFAKHHDLFMENFLGQSDLKSYQKERIVYTKNKLGYIAPCNLRIQMLNSALHGMQFMGRINIERHLRPIGYIMTDEGGRFEGISQTCLTLLKFDQKYIQGKRVLSEIFPNVMEDRESFMNKLGQIYQYSVPIELQEQQQKLIQLNSHLYQAEVEKEMSVIISLQEINFSTNHNVMGYIVKIDKNIDQSSRIDSSLISKNNLQAPKKLLTNRFCFYYNLQTLFIQGEYLDKYAISDIQSSIQDDKLTVEDKSIPLLKQNFNILDERQPFEDKQNIISRINYSEGIKTVRLFAGRIGEIEEINSEEMEQEEMEGEQLNGQIGQNQYYDEGDNHHSDSVVFKNRRNLMNMFIKQSIPPAVRNLKIVSNLLMLFIIVLTFVEYFLHIKELEDILLTIDQVIVSNNIKADFQSVYTTILDLQLTQLGIFNRSLVEFQLKQELHESIKNIEGELNQIQLSSLPLTSQQQQLYQGGSVLMNFSSDSSQKFGLVEATQQMLAKSFKIWQATLEDVDFTKNNQDVYFVLQNGLNTFLEAQNTSSTYLMQNFMDRTTDKTGKFLIIVIVVSIILFLSLLILVPVMLSGKYTKEEVIRLFLEIPDKIVKQLYTKSESFVTSFQIGEDEEVQSEMEDIMDRQDNQNDPLVQINNSSNSNSSPFEARKKRRKYKTSVVTPYGLYIKIILGSLIVVGYFILNFFISKQLMDQLNQVIPELNSTSFSEGFYDLADFTIRTLFVNNESIILDQPVFQNSLQNIDLLYQLDSFIHQEHSNNVKILSDTYKNAFNQIMMLDPCINFNINISDCQSFADGAISQGLAVAITRYFENIRYLLTLYINIQKNSTIDFQTLVTNANMTQYFEVSQDHKTNLQLNLLNLKEAQESRQMLKIYFNQGLRYLLQQFKKSVYEQQQSFITQRLALFLVFLIFLVSVYVLFWWPLANQMSIDIWRTRMQLVLIPVQYLIRLRNIKGYIRMIINDSVQHE